MKENTFLKKFAHKSNSELEYIIANQKKYTPEACLAASTLLKNRKETSAKHEQVENEVTSKKGSSPLPPSKPFKFKIGYVKSIIKWLLILLFFPFSVVIMGYYQQKRGRKAYWRLQEKNNR